MIYIKTSLPFPTLTRRINNRAHDPDFPLSDLQYIGATDDRAAWVVGNCAVLALGDDAGATLRLRYTMPYGNGLWGIDDAARYVWDELQKDLGELATDLNKHAHMVLWPLAEKNRLLDEQIAKMKTAGVSREEAAGLLQIPEITPTEPATVAREWLQTEKPKRQDPQTERREKVRELWQQSETQEAIASKLFCSVSTVKRDLANLELTQRRKANQT